MKKPFIFTFLLSVFVCLQAYPQQNEPFVTLDNLKFSTRADFTIDYVRAWQRKDLN